MFGRNRRKATEHTIQAIQPLIATYQNFSGLPPHFWRDEFVLGFIGVMIGFHGSVTSGRSLSQADKGYLLYDVFTALSNMNGQAIGRDYTRLATQSPKSPDFEKGAHHASICALASIGKITEEGQPYYEQAEEMAAAQGTPNDVGAIIGSLLHILFYQPLQERFDLGSP
ncbi:hypothetical protein [Chelativorans xinjiangense]|uniref:hypothetical protein n=1 Tax=Chelativorans xinjiangense TaxID=2681485 RepID=UPI00135CDB58|nr:hypothetical protein [Chelativorans xinjiangense]